jgi:uncharacterized protein (DUF302 family)
MEGLTTIQAGAGPVEAMERIDAAIKNRGMTVFARIDHAALAAQVGQDLRPTAVIVFGNPRGGTPLMQGSQTIGIDLPLKILVWQDAAGACWISYYDPEWLAQRHQVKGAETSIAALKSALVDIAASANHQ